MHRLPCLVFGAALSVAVGAQTPLSSAPENAPGAKENPDHRSYFPATYPLPYAPASIDEIKSVLDRVLGYLETATPVRIIDLDTKRPVADRSALPSNPGLEPTDYPLTRYEWGVTYSGMLLAAEVLEEKRYRDYVEQRLGAIAAVAAQQRKRPSPAAESRAQRLTGLGSLLRPRELDDAGSQCAAMIKASRAQLQAEALRPCIDLLIQWISEKQFRLSDQTLARDNPFPHTLWLDDLYMSVPALAQMGAMTGERRYFDDAVRQVTQFSARMFVREKGLFMHGWGEEMEPHRAFYWARANGWAIVAMAELLSVLPEDHPGRGAVLEIFRAHALGLANCQGGTGLWHQLLDQNDTYLETSATALYVYAIARGVNRGWLTANAFGPVLSLAWNAVAQQVNAQGQVENVCIGTGMGFDPAFYRFRPTSVWAAHGFGPVLLAGAEMITLRRGVGKSAHIGVGGVQFQPQR